MRKPIWDKTSSGGQLLKLEFSNKSQSKTDWLIQIKLVTINSGGSRDPITQIITAVSSFWLSHHTAEAIGQGTARRDLALAAVQNVVAGTVACIYGALAPLANPWPGVSWPGSLPHCHWPDNKATHHITHTSKLIWQKLASKEWAILTKLLSNKTELQQYHSTQHLSIHSNHMHNLKLHHLFAPI